MNNDFAVLDSLGEILCLFSVSEGKPEGMNINWRLLEPVQLQWCSQCVTQRSSQQCSLSPTLRLPGGSCSRSSG